MLGRLRGCSDVMRVAPAGQSIQKARFNEEIFGHSPWLRVTFLASTQIAGKSPTEPITSAIVPSGAARPGPQPPLRSRRSRTMSGLEQLRPRDSASISATSRFGNRTVIVLMW